MAVPLPEAITRGQIQSIEYHVQNLSPNIRRSTHRTTESRTPPLSAVSMRVAVEDGKRVMGAVYGCA